MPVAKVNPKVVYPELSYQITGILFEVHNVLGRFCQEKQYADAIEMLVKKAGIAYEREYQLEHELSVVAPIRNRVDFVIDHKIILELKAKHAITREDYLQAQRYLRTSHLILALLVNFRNPHLGVKRILNSQ